jgi:hypothetical protein
LLNIDFPQMPMQEWLSQRVADLVEGNWHQPSLVGSDLTGLLGCMDPNSSIFAQSLAELGCAGLTIMRADAVNRLTYLGARTRRRLD